MSQCGRASGKSPRTQLLCPESHRRQDGRGLGQATGWRKGYGIRVNDSDRKVNENSGSEAPTGFLEASHSVPFGNGCSGRSPRRGLAL